MDPARCSFEDFRALFDCPGRSSPGRHDGLGESTMRARQGFHALSKTSQTAPYKPQQDHQSDSRRPSEPRNEVNFGTARSKNSTLACAATIAFGDMLPQQSLRHCDLRSWEAGGAPVWSTRASGVTPWKLFGPPGQSRLISKVCGGLSGHLATLDPLLPSYAASTSAVADMRGSATGYPCSRSLKMSSRPEEVLAYGLSYRFEAEEKHEE